LTFIVGLIKDREYLTVTDYFSSFTEIYDLGKDATAPALIKELTQLFSRFGQPVEVVSDGGSQFTCKAFATFVESWNFIHIVSSPTHAQSNGKAEAAVKNVKKLFKKCGSMNDQFWKGLW
jgi:transposase InsO family protein